jgi:hypothetical protein
MKSHDFAAQLLKLPNMDLMILDGSNGGGEPRDLNLGPSRQIITEANAKEGADCEDKVGKEVLVIGYGFY